MKWSVALGRLLLLTGGLLAGLAASELVLRLSQPGGVAWMLSNSPALYDTSIFVVDNQRRLQLHPGSTGRFQTPEFSTSVRINSLGLRGPDPVPSTPQHVLMVGDSFTLGIQVEEEETFTERVQQQLSSSWTGVDVENGGVDSHGTWDAIQQIERVADIQELSAVVLTFFLGNDLWDNCNHNRRRLTPGPVQSPPRPHWLRQQSHLYTWFTIWKQQRLHAADPHQQARYRAELSVFAGAPLGREVGCSRLALQALGETLERLQIPGIVGLAPPVFAVDERRLAPTLQWVGLDPGSATVDAPAQAIAAVVPPSLTVVDLTPALRDFPHPEDLYFTFDGHWTAQGHQVVSEVYAMHLTEILP